jgi:hypothetical protein
VIDNSNYFDKDEIGSSPFGGLGKQVKYLSMSENLGKINKGLGELSMLEYSQNYINFDEYERILFFTGRHFVTSPFLINATLQSDSEIYVAKPIFYQLDGSSQPDGDLFSYNDMFFSMKPDQIKGYINFFRMNKQRLILNEIGSEQLLFEFVEEYRSQDSNHKLCIAPALGIVRFTRNILGRLKRVEIL